MAEYYEPTPSADLQATENKLVNKSLATLPPPYLSGLKLAADVHINGLTLNTVEQPTEANGYTDPVIWVVTDIEGWWTQPDNEMPDLVRGWGDGSYDAKGRYQSRLITLSGSILVQTPEDSPKARNALIQAISLVHQGGWLVVDETPVKGSFVRLNGQPEVEVVNPRGRIDFSIDLQAADPIKYEYFEEVIDGEVSYDYVDIPSGGASGSGGIRSIVNSGNIAVPVVFEISGGLPDVTTSAPATILNSTSNTSINIIGTTTSSQTLEIDTYNREVLLVTGGVAVNGRPKTETLMSWIYLEPGENVIEFEDTSVTPSSASCRVYWRSGWIG